MTFSPQSPGDEQYNNGETPHSGRDITNLSSFWLLAAGSPQKKFLSFSGTELPGFAQLSII